jgi:hypothetical protein
MIGEQGVFRRVLGLVFRGEPGRGAVVSVFGKETVFHPLQQEQVAAIVGAGVFADDRVGAHCQVDGHLDVAFLQIAAFLERFPWVSVGSS